mmetsp:Transcript_48905/g.91652  ORF Transcript_48905/g.91652 Transcript_48905/m.91652 type:complete len:342 (+) Transcript_48905:62-1087(+)
MLALCLVLTLCKELAADFVREAACASAVGTDSWDDDQVDIVFLQVQQNVSLVVENVSTNTLHTLKSEADIALVQQNLSTAQNLSNSQAASRTGAQTEVDFASVFVDLAVAILILLLIGVLFRLASRSEEVGPRGSKGRQGGEGAIAPVPILCAAYQIGRGEDKKDHSFMVDMGPLLSTHASEFMIGNEQKQPLMRATLSEGRMMKIKSLHEDGPGVLVRGSSTSSEVMLTIYSEGGAYFGKLAAGKGGGLIFSHMQKPCAEFKSQEGSFSIAVSALQDPSMKFATSHRLGPNLRVDVKAGYDPVLFLGCLLGIFCLEPTLVKLMEKIDPTTPMSQSKPSKQ